MQNRRQSGGHADGVSKKYLPLYVAEFQFRHNMRKDQGGMFNMVLRTSF